MTSTLNLSAVILTGGKSSRMGRDKALISIEGIPLLKRIATLAQQYANSVYIIAPWSDRYESIIPPDYHLLPETDSQGPLVGFTQALPHIKTEWVLLLACDLPNLTPTEMEKWLGYLKNAPLEAIALLPRHPKGWEPLCGFYRRSCLDSLETFIESGGRSFQQWLKQHNVAELPVTDPEILFNCNTPTDLTRVGYGNGSEPPIT